MKRKMEENKSTVGFWLPAALVIAATVGVMVWIGGKDEKPAPAEVSRADDEVLEVQPLVPKGKITDASWNRERDAAADDIESGASMLDGDLDPFRDEELARTKTDSLKRTIDRIHGLGVHVAPAEEDDD